MKLLTTEEQLKEYKTGIDTIFTRDNLPAILAVMNSKLPKDITRTKGSEYETIVSAAFYDGALSMINEIINFSNQNG